MVKGDSRCSIKKTVLGWSSNTVYKVLTLPYSFRRNIFVVLSSTPQRAVWVSKQKWFHLLGTIYSAIPAISGAAGIFIHVQNTLKTSNGRNTLTAHVHEKLSLWRHFVDYIETVPTLLR